MHDDPATRPGANTSHAPAADDDERRDLRAALTTLFGDDADLVADLASVADVRELPAGTVLFRHGDTGDSAFIVISGRLRAVIDGEDGVTVLSDAVHGETIGELGLITREPRSATVYAVRDSVVARIAGTDFEALLVDRPAAALPLLRILAGRLRRIGTTSAGGAAQARTVAVLAVGAADAGAFAADLAREMGSDARADLVLPTGADTHTDLHRLLEDHAGEGRLVACAGEPGWTAWNAFILRHADEVILVADATEDPSTGPVDAAVFAPRERGGPRVTLVLRHRPGEPPAGTARWLDPRPPLQHLHIRADCDADLARVGRWVSGDSIGLVLGGGGARGWAHIGVVRAFEELGIPIDLVGGTSHGAMVAAAVADLRTAQDMQDSARPLVRRLRDYTLPIVSVMRGRRLGRTLELVVRPGIAIEDLWLPYFAMATNLSRAERVVQDRGPVVDAIRASVSLPVVLPPIIRNGEILIDGGLLDNLPVGEMRRRVGSGWIVAIDPSPHGMPAPFDALEPDVSGFRLLLERLAPSARRRRVPSIGDMVQRTIMAGSRHLRSQGTDRYARTVVLHPELGDWGLLAFERLDEIVEAGYRELFGPIAEWWAGTHGDAERR